MRHAAKKTGVELETGDSRGGIYMPGPPSSNLPPPPPWYLDPLS